MGMRLVGERYLRSSRRFRRRERSWHLVGESNLRFSLHLSHCLNERRLLSRPGSPSVPRQTVIKWLAGGSVGRVGVVGNSVVPLPRDRFV